MTVIQYKRAVGVIPDLKDAKTVIIELTETGFPYNGLNFLVG